MNFIIKCWTVARQIRRAAPPTNPAVAVIPRPRPRIVRRVAAGTGMSTSSKLVCVVIPLTGAAMLAAPIFTAEAPRPPVRVEAGPPAFGLQDYGLPAGFLASPVPVAGSVLPTYLPPVLLGTVSPSGEAGQPPVAVPAPAALPIFMIGLALLIVVKRWRR